MILDILKSIRSHRSFLQTTISINELRYMIEGARYAGSARNSQLIRYSLISDKKVCNEIFKNIKFAGAIEWNPTLEESPCAYILLSATTETSSDNGLLYFDMGLATQNILLIAKELGYNGCIVGAYNKKEVEKIAELKSEFKSHFLIALGLAKDNVYTVPSVLDNIKYSRIGNNHYVPKLPLDEVILSEK